MLPVRLRLATRQHRERAEAARVHQGEAGVRPPGVQTALRHRQEGHQVRHRSTLDGRTHHPVLPAVPLGRSRAGRRRSAADLGGGGGIRRAGDPHPHAQRRFARGPLSLVDGYRVGPLLPVFPPALRGTFQSSYQLLPCPRFDLVQWDGDPARPADVLNPEVWERPGWGLAEPDQAGILTILDERMGGPWRPSPYVRAPTLATQRTTPSGTRRESTLRRKKRPNPKQPRPREGSTTSRQTANRSPHT